MQPAYYWRPRRCSGNFSQLPKWCPLGFGLYTCCNAVLLFTLAVQFSSENVYLQLMCKLPQRISAFGPVPNYTAWWQGHVCLWTTCPGSLWKRGGPDVEHVTCWSQVQRRNHYATSHKRLKRLDFMYRAKFQSNFMQYTGVLQHSHHSHTFIVNKLSRTQLNMYQRIIER